MIPKFRVIVSGKIQRGGPATYFLRENGKLLYRFEGSYYGANMDIHEVSLSTGLKDKNGKEIYEGDLLKTERHEDIIVGQLLDYGWVIGEFSYCGDNTVKIIGNRWENPELLGDNS